MKLPKVIVHHIKDVQGPPFLSLRHMKLRLEYPNGTKSKEFTHDIVERKAPDAAIIVGFASDMKGGLDVWMRSCVRPAVSSRVPFPNELGSIWELPAGLIDEGETPVEAAAREFKEEVGFDLDPSDFFQLGRPVWGNVGMSCERLHFYAVNLTSCIPGSPTLDGSPLEAHGECWKAPINEALKVGDLKTDLGILRLKEFLVKNKLVPLMKG